MEELPQILDGIKMTTSKQEIEKGTGQFRNVTRICIIRFLKILEHVIQNYTLHLCKKYI